MSLSPSFPSGAPTLSEVLIERTFAKPPEPFVDGEFLKALERADHASAIAASGQAGAGGGTHTPDRGSGSSSGETGALRAPASAAAPPASGPAKAIDVRV